MRTKALLLSAAIAACGTAFAQGTVSKNIVGYVNKTVPKSPALTLINNPLNNGGNKVSEVIKTTGDLLLYHYIGGTFQTSEAIGGEWAGGENIVVEPGGGFFATSTGAAEVKLTFVGEVAVGKSVSIPAGLSIRSSALPQAGTLQALEYPAGNEVIFQFVNGTYKSTETVEGEWVSDANVAVGEAFWVLNNGAAKTWNRTFTIQ